MKILILIILGALMLIFSQPKTIEPLQETKAIEIINPPKVIIIPTPKEFLQQEIKRQGLTDRDFKITDAIIFCESSWEQFYKDGRVKVSNGNVGLFQINIGAHHKEYKALGLDPYNAFDNLTYGVMLYKRGGVGAWKPWSGHCFIPILKQKGIKV